MKSLSFPQDKQYCIEVKRTNSADITVSGIDGILSPIEMFGSTGDDALDVSWTITKTDFELKNDRYGMFQVFYTQIDSNTLLISNYVEKILEKGGSTEFDDDAIAVFLRLGYCLGEDTPFKHIRVLPANSKIHVSQQGIKIQRGDKFTKSSSAPSYASAVVQYGDIFQQSMDEYLAKHATQDIMVPLSGGQDSRHILLSVLASGRKVQHCVTSDRLPPDSNSDVTVAKQLCEAVGLSNVLVHQQRTNLVQQEVNNFHLGSYCVDENNWVFTLAEYFRKLQQPTILFDGVAGDCLSASAWNNKPKLAMYRSGKLTELAKQILQSEGVNIDFLPQAQRLKWNAEKAVERISQELAVYQHTVSPFAHFYFWNRAVREIGHIPRTWLGRFGTVCTPYLFEPVFDFLINLPAEYSLGKTFHGQAIAQKYPKYADVPFAKHAAKTKAPFAMRYQFTKDAWKYLHNTPQRHQVCDFNYLIPRFGKGLLSSRYGATSMALAVSPLYLATLFRLQAKYGA